MISIMSPPSTVERGPTPLACPPPDRRKGGPPAFEKCKRPPRRDGVVEAALLDGGADDQPAVALGGHVDLLRPHDVSERSRVGRRANRKRLPLERTHWHREVRRQEVAGPCARREHDRRRPAASPPRGQSGNPAAFKVHARDGAMLEQKAAGCDIGG